MNTLPGMPGARRVQQLVRRPLNDVPKPNHAWTFANRECQVFPARSGRHGRSSEEIHSSLGGETVGIDSSAGGTANATATTHADIVACLHTEGENAPRH